MNQRLHRMPGLLLSSAIGSLPGIGLALLSTAQADGTSLARVAVFVTIAGVLAGAVIGASRYDLPP